MAQTQLTRSSILQRARDGDATDFVGIYAPLVVSMARRRGFPPDDAEDVAQQVMVELLERLPAFRYDRRRGTFKGYLKRIVAFKFADRARVRRHVSIDSVEGRDGLPATEHDLSPLFDREWIKTHLMAALEQVRTEVKVSTFLSFQLTVLQEQPVAEAAAVLGLSPNQVSQNKRRVLQRLRAHLAEFDDE